MMTNETTQATTTATTEPTPAPRSKHARKRSTKRARNGTGALLKRCACALDAQYRCKHGWHFYLRHQGARVCISIDKYLKAKNKPRNPELSMPKVDAEAVAAEIAAAVRTGTYDPSPTTTPTGRAITKPGAETVADAIRALVAEKTERKLASTKQDRQRLDVIARQTLPGANAAPFGEWPLATVTEADCKAIFALVTANVAEGKRGNSSRRKYRRNLKSVFSLGVERGWITGSPITERTAKTMKAGVCFMRERNVSIDEEARLIRAAESLGPRGLHLARVIVGLMETGARKGELLAIKVGHVHLAEGYIEITAEEPGARKTGTAREVLITPRLRQILDVLMVGPTGRPLPTGAYVFGDGLGGKVNVASLSLPWQRAVLIAHGYALAYKTGKKRQSFTDDLWAALKLIDLHKHDLRHEAALRWLRRGVTLNVIAKMLGHKSLEQLEVYLGINKKTAIAEARIALGIDTGEATKVEVATVVPSAAASVVPFVPKRRSTRAA